MEQPTQQSPFRRSPFEILGECFSICGRHFRKLVLIALIIQVPLAVLGFALGDRLPSAEDLQRLQVNIIGDPRATLPESGEYSTESTELPEPLTGDEIMELAIAMTGYVVVTLIFQTFVTGVFVYAVGMQYATGGIDVGRCYGRAWWRVLTLVILGLVLIGLIALLVAGIALFIIPGIIVLTLVIYWSMDVPAVVIEGYKPIGALRRSFELVRGNWWRTFAALALIVLVSFGLTTMLTLLITAPMALIGGDEGLSGTTANLANTLANLLTNAIVLPIAATGGALIYLDLRARKEEYDITTLAQELGFTPRSDEHRQDVA